MKTNEYITKIGNLSFVGEVAQAGDVLSVRGCHGEKLIEVWTNSYGQIDNVYGGYDLLSTRKKKMLMMITSEYIFTDLPDRVPERKFLLKIKDDLPMPEPTDKTPGRYFNYRESDGTFIIGTPGETACYKTAFTESEFNELFNEGTIEWINATFTMEDV